MDEVHLPSIEEDRRCPMDRDRGQVELPVMLPEVRTMNVRALSQRVMLVMPWHKSTNPWTAFTLMSLVDRRRTSLLLNSGDAFVAHARNTCADLFLATDIEWMLTVDDDMILPCGNGQWFNSHTGFHFSEPFCSFNALDRLLSHGKTLVGALYFGRHRHGPPMTAEGMHNEEEQRYLRKAPYDLIKPTRWVGTGCMLIHRSVFLDIEKKYPALARRADGMGGNWFTSTEHDAMDVLHRTRKILSEGSMTGEKAMAVYEYLEASLALINRNSSMGMGEDVQFCIRAREAGHQPYVDLGLICGHVGMEVYGPKNTTPKKKVLKRL